MNTDVSQVIAHNAYRRRRLWLRLGAIAVVFGAGIASGMALDLHKDILAKADAVRVTKIVNAYATEHPTEVDFREFWAIWDAVKEKYVDQPVDESKMFYGALEGMVRGLGDPHSVYFPPKEADAFAKDLAGELEGIGAEIGVKDGVITVIAPLPESPAERAGLKTGDKILMIDKTDTHGLSLDEAVGKIRGASGSTVALIVTRDGLDEAQELKIVRAKITIPTVITEKKDGNIAYIRITYFNQDTWPAFDKKVRAVMESKPAGIVLDLRSNPGGFLDTAIEVASEWIPSGVIVKERLKDGSDRTHRSVGTHRLNGIPTVVLVDEGSASGSEIVAGALQDYGAATLVGAKTYGKGSVQDFETLPDGSALKLTIAKWYTPKDRQIDKEGILPDIAVDPMFNTSTRQDLGLEKALELLRR
jgi:carboxyl-terminal processing protease